MTMMLTLRQPQTCERCGETKEARNFGCKSGGRKLNTVCRLCVREETRGKRALRDRETDRPGQWYAESDDATQECDQCNAAKRQDQFARGGGAHMGGGSSRWRRNTCKACVKATKTTTVPEVRWAEKAGRVTELFYCSDCAAQGIISPVPAGKRCPWHVYPLPGVPDDDLRSTTGLESRSEAIGERP